VLTLSRKVDECKPLVRGATAMLQRLSGAGALPPAAAAALRAAHDSAVAQGELWAGAYTRPLLSST